MIRALKWLGIAIGVLAACVVLVVIGLYAVSERIIRRTYDMPLSTIEVPPVRRDSATLAEGMRLARIRGCYDGCHGEGMDGGVFGDDPWYGRLVAPNLHLTATRLSDAELVRVIRHGVRQSGRSTLGMPSSMFYHLSDEDLGAILALIKSRTPSAGTEAEVKPGILARLELVSGKFPPYAQEIDHAAARLPKDTADPVAFGRYLATTSCSECHGMDFQGDPNYAIPSLTIASGYSDADFARLMRIGIALGNRELGLMSQVARSRFANFSDVEVRSVHAFLRTLKAPPRAE